MWIAKIMSVHLALLIAPLCKAATVGNILAITMQGDSRYRTMIGLGKELKQFGYKLTVILPAGHQIEKTMADSGIDVIVSEGLTKYTPIFNKAVAGLAEYGFSGITGAVPSVQDFDKFCPYLVGDKILMETLQKRRFGAVIIDTVLANLCVSVIPYKLSIPFIHFGRIFQLEQMRTLVHPGVYPVTFFLPLSDKMTFTERVYNSLVYTVLMVLPDKINPRNVVGKFAPEMPHLTNAQLQAKTELYLLETDEIMDHHLPTPPDMKLVGGVETGPATPLTGDLKSFMDSATSGAVIVSFGTIIKYIPESFFNKLTKAFNQEESLKFVFHLYDNDTKTVRNVMTMPWIPQNDLLGHKNTKIFISHCGSNGQYEALYHGVPMIGIPVFGDQPYNALRMERKGFGIFLNVVDFTPMSLRSAIQEVLTNQSYQESIRKASVIFKNRPMTPGKRAAWWIDHVIKYGGSQLHSEARNLPLYQFLLHDVLICIFFAFLLFISTGFMCLKIVYLALNGKQKKD